MQTQSLSAPFSQVSGKRLALELAFAISAALAIPQIMHLLGVAGNVFLPIYTAVILAALFVHPGAALLTAGITPLLNHLVSGMPITAPLPIAQILTAELLLLAVLLLVLKKLPTLLRLAIALIGARLAGLAFIPFFGKVSFDWWLGVMQTGLPGLALQFAIGWVAVYYFGPQTDRSRE